MKCESQDVRDYAYEEEMLIELGKVNFNVIEKEDSQN